ncbi:twin-arginine translocation pathway signal protein, partial [Stutzerimonas stutzeri]
MAEADLRSVHPLKRDEPMHDLAMNRRTLLKVGLLGG